MPAPTRPAGTKAYLRKKVVFVPADTYDPEAPSLAVLNAASALDVTKMLYASSASPSQSTNMARAPRRLGDGETYEFVGESQSTIGEMRYSFNPQAAALSDGKKASEKFPAGTTGYLVYRYGIDRDTDLATAQFVTSYPVEFGPQQETEEGDAEGAEVAIVQSVAQTGPKSLNKAIVA
jgi:hypothetical protein